MPRNCVICFPRDLFGRVPPLATAVGQWALHDVQRLEHHFDTDDGGARRRPHEVARGAQLEAHGGGCDGRSACDSGSAVGLARGQRVSSSVFAVKHMNMQTCMIKIHVIFL